MELPLFLCDVILFNVGPSCTYFSYKFVNKTKICKHYLFTHFCLVAGLAAQMAAQYTNSWPLTEVTDDTSPFQQLTPPLTPCAKHWLCNCNRDSDYKFKCFQYALFVFGPLYARLIWIFCNFSARWWPLGDWKCKIDNAGCFYFNFDLSTFVLQCFLNIIKVLHL